MDFNSVSVGNKVLPDIFHADTWTRKAAASSVASSAALASPVTSNAARAKLYRRKNTKTVLIFIVQYVHAYPKVHAVGAFPTE